MKNLMSRYHFEFPPFANLTFLVSISGTSDFRSEIEMQLQDAVVPKPSGRLELSARLGYPDFEPAPNAPKEADEDRLDPKRLREGYCDPAAGLFVSASSGGER
jgi:hypothetical protein